MYSYLFFDLDGTLTDSKEGILKSLRYAFERMGRPIPPEETLLRVLQKKYGRVLGEEAGRRRAAAAMQRLGYSYEQIRRALRRAAPEITDEDEEYNGI